MIADIYDLLPKLTAVGFGQFVAYSFIFLGVWREVKGPALALLSYLGLPIRGATLGVLSSKVDALDKKVDAMSKKRELDFAMLGRSFPPGANYRVLLVEDDDNDRDMFIRALGDKLTIVEATDMANATRLLRRNGFDAVLLDLAMGNVRGEATIKLAQEADRTANFIIWTGNPEGATIALKHDLPFLIKKLEIDPEHAFGVISKSIMARALKT